MINKKGITLVEVIVASIIMVMVIACVTTALFLGLRQHNEGVSLSTEYKEAMLLEDFLEAQLKNIGTPIDTHLKMTGTQDFPMNKGIYIKDGFFNIKTSASNFELNTIESLKLTFDSKSKPYLLNYIIKCKNGYSFNGGFTLNNIITSSYNGDFEFNANEEKLNYLFLT